MIKLGTRFTIIKHVWRWLKLNSSKNIVMDGNIHKITIEVIQSK